MLRTGQEELLSARNMLKKTAHVAESLDCQTRCCKCFSEITHQGEGEGVAMWKRNAACLQLKHVFARLPDSAANS